MRYPDSSGNDVQLSEPRSRVRRFNQLNNTRERQDLFGEGEAGGTLHDGQVPRLQLVALRTMGPGP